MFGVADVFGVFARWFGFDMFMFVMADVFGVFGRGG